jgi:hypothetical protein
MVRYSNSALGFAVDCPGEWQVTGPTAQVDPSMRPRYVVEFVSDLYVYGEQAFGRYGVRVAAGESIGGTLTETVAYSLAPIVPQVRDQIETRCCLEVGGEPAMELVGFPLTRWGSRQIVVLHEGREYSLTFYPQIGLDGSTLSDVTARTAFETFLRTFTFIPITAPPPVTPTVTPAPTPMPTETATRIAMPAQVRLASVMSICRDREYTYDGTRSYSACQRKATHFGCGR